MTLLLEEEVEIPFSFDYKQVAEDVVKQTLAFEEFPYEVEVSMVLTDDASIHQLNQEFRHMDRATDVLSFPMLSYTTAGDYSEINENICSDSGTILLGDIVISVEHVLAQAEEFGHSQKREFAFLIAHSMLHLLGYDHMSPEEASIMEKKQTKILEFLHITREE